MEKHLLVQNALRGNIIIYHDFLLPSRRGSHVKTDYAHRMIKRTPLSPFSRNLRLDFKKLRFFFSLPQPRHVTASHSSPSDNPPELGRAAGKNAGPSKNGPKTHIIYICTRPLTPSHLSRIVAQPPPPSLCYSRPSSRHPSNLTSVSSEPALHLYPP